MTTFAKHEHGAWCHPSADGCPMDMPAPALSAEEEARVAAFEAAPELPEVVRERVARALWDEAQATVHMTTPFDEPGPDRERARHERYLCLADAAIAAMGGAE